MLDNNINNQQISRFLRMLSATNNNYIKMTFKVFFK